MSGEPVDRTAINRTLESIKSVLFLLPGRLAAITNEGAGQKTSAGVWSKKEELGHLIDSASNNHQRIVRAQMESSLALPGYDGDRWVELHGYQRQHWNDLIVRWRELNRQLLAAAEAVPDSAWSHALTIGDSEVMTLGFVFVDYLRHMAHHLRHIGVQVDDLLDGKPLNERPVYPEKPASTDHSINELMVRRWSPRGFEEGRRVEREKVLALLEAARWAPSCFNDQPRYFLVFDGSNAADLDRARACLVPGNAWATKAPMLMLSVAREAFEQNGKPNRHGQHDTGLATENLFLQAVEMGLVAHAMAGFDAERARSDFEIPDGFTPMAMIAIGYPFRGDLKLLDEKTQKGEVAPRTRKPIGEIAFKGKWSVPYPRQ